MKRPLLFAGLIFYDPCPGCLKWLKPITLLAENPDLDPDHHFKSPLLSGVCHKNRNPASLLHCQAFVVLAAATSIYRSESCERCEHFPPKHQTTAPPIRLLADLLARLGPTRNQEVARVNPSRRTKVTQRNPHNSRI